MYPVVSNPIIAYHRNGISGNPFHVVVFQNEEHRNLVATVFETGGSVAVLDVDLLADQNINFGENSWRGDVYEPILRKLIARWEENPAKFAKEHNPGETEWN